MTADAGGAVVDPVAVGVAVPVAAFPGRDLPESRHQWWTLDRVAPAAAPKEERLGALAWFVAPSAHL